MSKDARFWRNVALIALAHVAILIGLVRWSREPKSLSVQGIVWMNSGGAGDGDTARAAPKLGKVSAPTGEPKPIKKDEPDEERPILTSATSEIQLPSATPKPTPTSTTAPKPSVTPKATPKPRPKATPKPKKMVLAKASPKPSAKPTPDESDEETEKPDVDAEKKRVKKAALGKSDSGDEKPKKAIAAHTGSGKGTSAGAGGKTGGAGAASQFGWYGNMLHDRFYSEWIQPTTVTPSSEKISVLVKLRIEQDGRVSEFEVVKPSGNVVVDESVAAVAKRITQVDPLPEGLGSGGHYDVRINFELNSEQ